MSGVSAQVFSGLRGEWRDYGNATEPSSSVFQELHDTLETLVETMTETNELLKKLHGLGHKIHTDDDLVRTAPKQVDDDNSVWAQIDDLEKRLDILENKNK